MANTTNLSSDVVVPQRFHDLMRETPFAKYLDTTPIQDDEPAEAMFRAVFAATADAHGDRKVTLTPAQLDELYTVAVTMAAGADRARVAGNSADREALSAVMRQVENADHQT